MNRNHREKVHETRLAAFGDILMEQPLDVMREAGLASPLKREMERDLYRLLSPEKQIEPVMTGLNLYPWKNESSLKSKTPEKRIEAVTSPFPPVSVSGSEKFLMCVFKNESNPDVIFTGKHGVLMERQEETGKICICRDSWYNFSACIPRSCDFCLCDTKPGMIQ